MYPCATRVKSLLTWDLPTEMAAYLAKLSYVSLSSRLDRDAERVAVDAALDQIAKEVRTR